MLHNDEDSKPLPKKTEDDHVWLYILIGLMSTLFASDAEPQRPARPDTGRAAARAIFARAESAIGRPGGRDALTYSHTVTETSMTPEATVVTEVWTMKPNKVFTRMTVPRMGAIEFGYNGAVGWSSSPLTGPVLLEGQALKEMEKLQKPQSVMDLPFKTLSAGLRTVVEGKNVAPVHFSDSAGNSGTLYFDVATGLPHAATFKAGAGEQGDSSMFMLYGDYKRFDGVLVNTTMTMRSSGHSVVTKTTHVDHKVIDSARFTPPAAVLTQMAKRP